MSKGNPKVVVRLPFSLMQQVRDAVEKRNAGHVSSQHWDVSEYVRVAIADKLKHDARGRKRRRQRSDEQQAQHEVEQAFHALARLVENLESIEAAKQAAAQYFEDTCPPMTDLEKGTEHPLDDPRNSW